MAEVIHIEPINYDRPPRTVIIAADRVGFVAQYGNGEEREKAIEEVKRRKEGR